MRILSLIAINGIDVNSPTAVTRKNTDCGLILVQIRPPRYGEIAPTNPESVVINPIVEALLSIDVRLDVNV